MMDQFLKSFIAMFNSFDRGDLANYPDPSPPSDLGSALTQDDIDFVKSLKKEMVERFENSSGTCTAEKTGVGISDTTASAFSINWTNPIGYTGTAITYRIQGSSIWLVPNAAGNATGVFSAVDGWEFTSGLLVGIVYEIRVQNQCTGGILSTGTEVSGTAT